MQRPVGCLVSAHACHSSGSLIRIDATRKPNDHLVFLFLVAGGEFDAWYVVTPGINVF